MEEISLIRTLLALGFVIGLIYAVSWLLKRLPGQHFAGVTDKSSRRLTIVEQMHLDPKRRLVLVRCDEQEHLLLLGNQRELVVAEIATPKSIEKAETM
jgi:flagellar protein FliO/FliZ